MYKRNLDKRTVKRFIGEAILKPKEIARRIARENEFNLDLESFKEEIVSDEKYVLIFKIGANQEKYLCSLKINKAIVINRFGEEEECWKHVYNGVRRKPDRSLEKIILRAYVIDKEVFAMSCRGYAGYVPKREVYITSKTPENILSA